MMFKRLVLLSSLLLFMQCGQEEIPYTTTSTTQTKQLNALGQYEKMVLLEAHDEALLGGISKVEVDKKSNDILVADTFVTHSVYRFSSEGNYICKYGGKGQGPGEYERLFTFTSLDNGNIVLFGMGKRMVFSPNGSLILEKFSNSNDAFADTIENTIFLYSLRGTDYEDTMITVLDEKLNPKTGFHPLDKKTEKLIFFPLNGLTTLRNQIVVSDTLDFNIYLYKPNGEMSSKYSFPNQNQELASLWNKSEREFNHKSLAFKIRRANTVQGIGDKLFILEAHPETGTLRPQVLDIKNNRLTIYEGPKIIGPENDGKQFTMDQIVGRYSKGMIGLCSDPEAFSKHKSKLPFLTDIEFNDNSNPLLLFFKIH